MGKGKCFAFEGVSGIGVIDDYDCGIMTRIESWLQALDVDYITTPQIEGCLMHKNVNAKGIFVSASPEFLFSEIC